MKALVIIALCILGLWGICKGLDHILTPKQKASIHRTERKASAGMRKAYDAASGAVDKGFQPALDYTEKEWPQDFDAFMASIDGRDSEARRRGTKR